jgi:cob(I)alamin adenosyltransferase
MIVIEDAAPTADIKRGLEEGGLAELASAVPITAGEPTPTLRSLIDSVRRLLVMAEDKGDATGWYRRAFDVLQETPFAFTSTAQLERPDSCRPNRGGTRPPLFLVNHWVENYPPRPRDASVVNEREFIVRRARECARIRDRTPTLIAVDFVERGNLIGAVDELNSSIGVLLAEAVPEAVRKCLTDVQHDLFDLGGELSIPGYEAVSDEHVARVEDAVERFNADLAPLKEFILPGGARAAGLAHVARTVCRRAERSVVHLAAAETVPDPTRRYLNRLSDLLFVLARVLNRAAGGDDILWQKGRRRGA